MLIESFTARDPKRTLAFGGHPRSSEASGLLTLAYRFAAGAVSASAPRATAWLTATVLDPR
jgi:hypothetical protein